MLVCHPRRTRLKPLLGSCRLRRQPTRYTLAAARDRYIAGLARFRGDGIVQWIEQFAAATAHSANLAQRYLGKFATLMNEWREKLSGASGPRSDAAAWAVIDVLPGYPVITGPVAAAATGRSKGSIYTALEQLQVAGVLIPLSTSRRNQSWEADGLLELLEALGAGDDSTESSAGQPGEAL